MGGKVKGCNTFAGNGNSQSELSKSKDNNKWVFERDLNAGKVWEVGRPLHSLGATVSALVFSLVYGTRSDDCSVRPQDPCGVILGGRSSEIIEADDKSPHHNYDDKDSLNRRRLGHFQSNVIETLTADQNLYEGYYLKCSQFHSPLECFVFNGDKEMQACRLQLSPPYN